MDKNYLKNIFLKILSLKYLRWSLFFIEKYRDQKCNFKELEYKIKGEVKKRSLVVIYRISSVNSKKSPVFRNNKYSLVKFCLNSFVKSFSDISYKIIFILDNCSDKYIELIKSYKNLDYEIVNLKNAGNKKTWFLQLNIARNLENCFIYFAEDDYYFREKVGKKLIEGLKEYDFISLHNQLDDKNLKNGWHKVDYSCLSFGTNSNIIRENISILKKYGTFDYPMWMDFKDLGKKMFTWIPTFSTHLVKNKLSKGVNWEKEWRK